MKRSRKDGPTLFDDDDDVKPIPVAPASSRTVEQRRAHLKRVLIVLLWGRRCGHSVSTRLLQERSPYWMEDLQELIRRKYPIDIEPNTQGVLVWMRKRKHVNNKPNSAA
jgi:hypothetical protein